MANVLQLTSFNRNLTKNKAAHHTSDYSTSQLVLRRGQSFLISLKLNRPMKANDAIKFVVEIGKSPTAQNKIKTTFSLTGPEETRGPWSAVADSTTSTTVNVSISSPVNAIIGSYRLTAQFFSGGYISHVLGDFVLLFNPWASYDDVYLDDESEREEYVLSDSTIVYHGSEDHIGEQGWNLGQFEDDILQICLKILEKQTSVDLSLLYDPKEVSRICSAMINSNDDKGVVMGNWSDSYAGGSSPTSWTGSVEILRKWSASGPVKYGQCWVFAGVLCTVLRCLGIPTRIVTNFNSAHDTDETLTIDTFYDSKGNNLGGDDSIWNFHVWNESWFTRPDIGSYYNGWQAVDATPQETSQGIYRLGPTSVIAVREGDIQLPYDCPFVYSEVNADRVSWLYDEDKDSYQRIQTNTTSIGKFTSTKDVGTNKRIDITSLYKNKEGTAAERESYHNALLQLHGRRTIDSDEPDARMMDASPTTTVRAARATPVVSETFQGQFKDSDPTVIGQDVNVILVLHTTSAHKNIIINFNVNSTFYTRRVMTSVLNESRTISMAPNEEKEIPFKIPYSKYIESLTEDKVLAVSALCRGDDNQKLLVSKVITLQNPSLNIKVLNKAVLNKPLNVQITITNPLNEPLDECEIRVEGSGLVKGQEKRKISLKPKEKRAVTVSFTPYLKGTKQLQVVVTSRRITNIKGYTTINVVEE